jgi:hypothetical protein
MFVARFSYSIRPIDRDRALTLLAQEVAAARAQKMDARLLVPLTRASGGAALQYELMLKSLDDFERFRDHGVGGAEGTRAWLRDLSELLLEPPAVELLRIADAETAADATGADWQTEQAL